MAQGPTDDDDKYELRKAWTMEMLTNDGDISMSMMNEQESMSKDDKKFLYARAVHSNHSIQYHMHQIIERQRVVDVEIIGYVMATSPVLMGLRNHHLVNTFNHE